jgi:uncharacterized protein with HEPN domain
MQRDPRAHLADVLEAGRYIQKFTAESDRDAYAADLVLRSAVERQFEIVGEALNRLSREDPALAARIPGVSRIIGFRNVLAHGYDIVDDDAVWDAVTRDLPGLIAQASALLAELEAGSD